MKSYLASDIRLLEATQNLLGEGLSWDPKNQQLFWVDIINRQLWSKYNNQPAEKKSLDDTITALNCADSDAAHLWVLTSNGLALRNIFTLEHKALGQFSLPNDQRTNDGNVASDGRYWFGSMQKTPSGPEGSIYSVGIQGDYSEELSGFGIPNTFASSFGSSHIYISDSLKKITYEVDLATRKRTVYLDLSQGAATPDGGALDGDGNLWIALWDGFGVKCYSPDGEELDFVQVPVPRPTNCCFGGPNMNTLYITSARDGLDEGMLEKYPLSGSVFAIDLNVRGAQLPAFGDPGAC